MYTDETFKTPLASFGTVKAGDTIYWVTKSTDGRQVYHHVGTAQTVDGNKPNHS